MKRQTALAAVLMAATLGMSAQRPMSAPKGGKAISDELIGIFFEDISSSADGGLFAELVQNGGFEYNANEKDGWGPATAWKVIRPGHSLGFIRLLRLSYTSLISSIQRSYSSFSSSSSVALA